LDRPCRQHGYGNLSRDKPSDGVTGGSGSDPYLILAMKSEDIESMLNAQSSTRSGSFRLWVAVLLDAVLTLKGERVGSRELAETFIFDTGNVFLELTCGMMNLEPTEFRKRLEREILGLQRIEIWQSRERQRLQAQPAP